MRHKVLIISDSHGLTKELAEIRARHHDVDKAIHCGDSELTEDDLNLTSYRVVGGNCDWNGFFPNDIVFKHGGLNFLITHGHLYDIKRSLMKLDYKAQETKADIVCFGHSHVAYAEIFNDRLFINPGSIRLPRHFVKQSYVILEWDKPDEISVQFYDANGLEITEFPYKQSFSFKK